MNKVLSFINKGIAVWVALFGIIAYLSPAFFNSLGKLINLFFALAMFGIGLVITEENYQHIIRQPAKIVFGTICQFTIMPLLAMLTSKLFHLSSAWTVGLILTGAAPGAMTSNVISYLSKGDVAYSVSLTALSTLLCPVLTPLITLALAGQRIPVSFMPMFKTIVLVVVIPLLAGFLIRKYFPRSIKLLGEIPSTVSVLAIVMITSYVIAVNRENLGFATVTIIFAVAFHNAMGMILGFAAGYIGRLDYLRRKTLSIEIGMQNAGLGVVLAITHFGHEVAVPAAIFTVWCIFTASSLVYFWTIFERKSQQAKK